MILPLFKMAGNLPLFIILFKKSQICAEKTSTCSFKLLAGIAVICVAFLAFNLLICLKTSLMLIPQK